MGGGGGGGGGRRWWEEVVLGGSGSLKAEVENVEFYTRVFISHVHYL